jgi:hypothetical protein
MTYQTFSFALELRLCAAALSGDPEAVEKLANSPDLEELIISNRLAPGLAIHAANLGIEGPQVAIWNDHMRAAAAQRLQLEHAMNRLGAVFAAASIRWSPLKGMGFDPRIYPRPEERISTDLDVLISPDHLDTAVEDLEANGWRSLITTKRQHRYMLDEGYNWKAAFGDGLLLELHFRLWGGVQEALAKAILDRAVPAPELSSTAQRVDLADAYLIAAVHVWQTPPPRYLMLWWDLHRIANAMDDQNVRAAIDRINENGLQAYVAPAAAEATDLWDHPTNRLIADELEDRLRSPERWASKILSRSSPTSASLGVITLGRLLANRPSRSGWRAIPRQIWAHPGTVESDTPKTWSWPKRRLTHIARKLHLTKK